MKQGNAVGAPDHTRRASVHMTSQFPRDEYSLATNDLRMDLKEAVPAEWNVRAFCKAEHRVCTPNVLQGFDQGRLGSDDVRCLRH